MALGITRLARVSLNSADAQTLARFYIDAFGFTVLEVPARFPHRLALALGTTRLDIVTTHGAPYPGDVAGWSPLFQHCAIVTPDMTRAMAHLKTVSGWTAISQGGPQQLPQASGGVTAFKFRDPEGHPLEFLEFSARSGANETRLFQDINHSAISVTNTQRSIAFYSALGLHAGASSLNQGPEQARLDSVPHPEVEVTALEFASQSTPHIELLCYRGAFDRAGASARPDDIAASRLVCAVATPDAVANLCQSFLGQVLKQESATALLRDPDGHLIEIELDGEATLN
ncbi:MAG TPA: VOC family protein [Methylovirgula sp.]